jgi:carboxypeptidase Q
MKEVLVLERDRLARIRRDFPLKEEELWERVLTSVAEVTREEFEGWVEEGRFDWRMVDGEERFFGSSLSNLFFRHPELESRRRPARDSVARQRAYLENARAIRKAAKAEGRPWVLPKRLKARMTLDVRPGHVSEGGKVAVWLPIPRGFPHQTDITWLGSDPSLKALAPEGSALRSAYFETQAGGDGSVTVWMEYAYTAWGVWHDLGREGMAVDGRLAKARVEGQEAGEGLGEGPQVRFTSEMRALAASLGGGGSGQTVEVAKRYYDWIAEHIRYSYAPEYSTVDDLAERCRATGVGDCGQVAFLFMTLCRISGIPARWQSGWSLFPGDQTIHDWCEVYLEPWGWVPVDPYMGMYAMQYAPALSEEERRELRDFYFGGLTQYRMAANADHQQALFPPKRFGRSDPVDFQRGEVETADRNLYFDAFRYRLEWSEEPAASQAVTVDRAGWMEESRVSALLSAATNNGVAMARLVELCDTFGPRFSGTTNLEAAIDWSLDLLRQDGFSNVRGEPVLVPRWVRGEESLEELMPRFQSLPVLGLGGTVGTLPEGVTASVLVVTNFAELQVRQAEAVGRIVVFQAPYTAYGDIVRYRYRGAIEAAKAGAVASLVRSATPFSLQTPHTGGMAYEEGVPKIPHAAITVEEGERLLREQQRGRTPVLRLRLGARTLPDVISRNVIAELPGRERPEEVVVVGGHIDSWDVAPGALDDAGGCVAAWEALRLLKESGYRPRRTLRLVLWTNEENGLRGARAYADRMPDELARHVVAIESDWGIGPVKGFAFAGSGQAQVELRQILGWLRELGADQLQRGSGGSDLGPLLQAGVPVMDLWTDRRDYFWFHHSAADTVDKVDAAELNRCVAALAVMLYGLAEMPEPLTR